MTPHALDNPAWNALTGPHAALGLGDGAARCYPRDIAPYSAIMKPTAAAYVDLAAMLPHDRDARLFRPRNESAPAGWETLSARPIAQMVTDGSNLPAPFPVEAAIVPLGAGDAAEMLALADIAKPGPFAARTFELGRYIGIREPATGRLVAMGGERFCLHTHVELSAIAVHPDARGRGLGAAITAALSRAVLASGKIPFLHAYRDNPAAALYARLGFRERATLWVLLWRRRAAGGTA